jgi:predicted HTH transcriptional regulator
MINNKYIREILETGENSEIEILEKLKFQDVGKFICSFLNGNGGKIVIGVNEDGSILGIEEAADQSIALKDFLLDNIIPEAPFDVSLEYENDKEVLFVRVYEGSRKPYIFDGSIFYRNGAKTIKATSKQLAELIHDRSLSEEHWERRSTIGFSRHDLDERLIYKTMNEAANNHRSTFIGKDYLDFLAHYGLYSNGSFTNACVILFAKNAARFIPQIRVRLTEYASQHSKSVATLRDELFEGNIFDIRDDLERYFLNLGTRTVNDPTKWVRKDFKFPVEALKEGVINALIHRDYSSANGGISISVYPETIVIANTGSFPEGISAKDLKKSHISQPVNPDIAQIVFIRGLIDKLGKGTVKILEVCKEEGLRDPEWKDSNNGITLTYNGPRALPTSKEKEVNDVVNDGVDDGVNDVVFNLINDGVNEGVIDAVNDVVIDGVRRIVAIVADNEGINTIELTDRVDKSKPTVQRYIKIARDLNLITFIGAAKSGGYYLTNTLNFLSKSIKPMQDILINIIPFQRNAEKKSFGFFKTKQASMLPLKKMEYPKALWEKHEAELKDIKRLYSDFTTSNNPDFVAEVDLTQSWKFADHYYTHLIFNYFLGKADGVLFGYVNDVQVWYLDKTAKNEEYNTYSKYSIRVQYGKVSQSMEIALSYDGTSLVHKTGLENLNLPPEDIIKVLHKGKVSYYEEVHQEIKYDLAHVYPVLSKTLQDKLTIERPVRRETNKYKPYLKEIRSFYKTHLDNDSFRSVIPLSYQGFIHIPDEDILKTKNSSNQLVYGKDEYGNYQQGIEPKKDFLKYGPYAPSKEANVRFLFVYQESDKDRAVAKAYRIFRDGLADNYLPFPPLNRALKQNFYFDKSQGISFQSPETAEADITNFLVNKFDRAENTFYVALYISPIDKNEKDHTRLMLYYRIKEILLNNRITSQVIFKESLFNNSLKWYLPNIAVAILAKINGVPWRLDALKQDDLIVGVGAFSSISRKTKYVGSTIAFNNDGSFQGFNCFNSNATDLLAGEISKAIMQYVDENKTQAKRLVIHFYKKISNKDLKPIMHVLENHSWKIPVVVITVNKTVSHDYVAFDTNSENLMPVSGSIIPVGRDQYLLFNNTRYNVRETVTDNPFPVKLTFSSSQPDLLRDKQMVKELIDQVYQFSRMYWKSVRQQNLPVTIKYPEMVAEIFPFFEADALPIFGQKNLWFL